ncbi:MAG: RagB/SusD family nutrient uptake outer membrane protein [Chitinophagaceae bacterium]
MKKTVIILLLSSALISCKKDFLTIAPQSQSTEANFYKTTADITNAVTAAYAPLQGSSQYNGHFVTMMEARADNVEDQNPGGNAGRDYNIDRFIAKSDNVAVSGAWGSIYNAIARCNTTLSHLDVVTNASLKSQYEGELRFLRALNYFNIVRLWGAAPLVLKPTSSEESKSLTRNAVSEIYAAIEEDLTKAATLLPAVYTNSTDIGRATAGSAKALLGKAYLTEKKYAQAAAVLKELLPVNTNAYKYNLLSTVADVFNVNNKMNAEIIFAVRYDKTISGQGHGLNAYFNQPVLDPKLLSAYGSTDTRRAMLNTTTVDANNKPVNKYYETFDATTKTLGRDYVVLRYADVLLMYAEALNEVAYSNDEAGDAFLYLNKIRTRAGATTFTAAMLPDQASFRAAVLQERRLEFPLELQRWFDLVRTNTAIEALKNSGLTVLNIQATQFLYPIPQSEIDIMNNAVTFPQNLGY